MPSIQSLKSGEFFVPKSLKKLEANHFVFQLKTISLHREKCSRSMQLAEAFSQ